MGDKRTLLAFLLIGLIFLIMPYYYDWMGLVPAQEESTDEVRPEPPPAGRESATPAGSASEGARPLPESQLTSPPTAAVPPEPAQKSFPPAVETTSFDEAEVRVTTPLQELTFSTAGGVLKSVRLPRYDREPGNTVELMPPGARGLSVTLFDERGNLLLDLSEVEFTSNRTALVVEEGEGTGTLVLQALLGAGRRLSKRFEFDADHYGIQMFIDYEGFDEQTVAQIAWDRGIEIAERVPSVDLMAMQAMAFLNESLYEVQADEDGPEIWSDKGSLRWLGVRSKYFICSIAPANADRHSVELIARFAQPVPEFEFRIGTRLARSGSWNGLLYLGPLDYEELILYDVEMERAMDLGFPVIREISKLLLVLFVAAHTYVPNYGYVIILFAVAVKIIVYPLTHKSYESAAKMQALQPKIAALKEKYKSDNQRLSRETMKLYKDEGVNPLGGCLPLLLQMPIFIALYQTFSSTIELRQAPFILWIDDLSLPDEIVIADTPIHVLPLLMSTAMFFQSKMTMKDPKQAALVYIMPAVMIFIMWSFSSGLVLYWTVFNVLQIAQQYLTNRYKQNKARAVPEPR